tara:strand:+ start:5105 stop:5386 length:282 start_codon:yes stop_codon:yes gene_type:complete
MFALCVCCRELRARVKVGCFFFGRRFCTKVHKKTSKKKKKREKKREFLPQKREKKKNRRTRLCKESLDWKKILSFFRLEGKLYARQRKKRKRT